jgi:dTDP-4-dehydrorhamnose reductase
VGGLLITGGSGYLGSELMRRAPGATGTHLVNEGPGTVPLDVRDAAAVDALVRELRPRVVIHTAYSEAGDEEALAINEQGSGHVARAAAGVEARLVHVSTDLVFDGSLGRPYTEDDEPRPIIEYGRQKLAAESAVRSEHPGPLIVRTSLIYGGPEAEPSKHELLIADPGGMKFFTDELRSPVQVGDLAQALLELAEMDIDGVLHVAGGDGVSRYELARLVSTDPHSLEPGLAAEHPTPRPLDCRLDSSRARGLLATRLRGVTAVLGA